VSVQYPLAHELGTPRATEFTRTRVDLDLFRSGDLTAFDRLWTRYRAGLELLASSKIAGVRNASVRTRLSVDDILQDTALVALRKLGGLEFRGTRSLYAWFDALIGHAVQDAVDRWESGMRDPQRERRANVGPYDAESLAAEIRDTAPGPASSTERTEARRRILDVLTQLDERRRRLVTMHYYFGADWAEIAEELGAASADAARKEHARMLPELALLLRRKRD
jgi:RNA polymerase sigma factor (sigma-70 family)